jgi:hypothetical protein
MELSSALELTGLLKFLLGGDARAMPLFALAYLAV